MSDDVRIRVLGREDLGLLESVADEVFDHAVRPELAREFLEDPRHHLAVALDAGSVVGFASGVHYVHPDKPAELFVNEVGVAPSHQRRGIAARLLEALFDRARGLGCGGAWVLTDPDNLPARRLYASVGGREAPSPQSLYEFDLGARARSGAC